MEPLLRGVMEQDLDRILDMSIGAEVKIMDRLELLIKSKEDYLRGFVVGYLNSSLVTYLNLFKRKIAREDIIELYERIISGRSAEIEKKIIQVLSR